jgi:hypothetical protein
LKGGSEDIELASHPEKEDSAIQKFSKRTRWRRKKSVYDTGVQDDEISSLDVT